MIEERCSVCKMLKLILFFVKVQMSYLLCDVEDKCIILDMKELQKKESNKMNINKQDLILKVLPYFIICIILYY